MKPIVRHAANAHIAAPLLAGVLGCALVTGCIVIPVDYHATGSRHNITMTSTNVLRVGVSTREDVLLACGEPDFVSEDGRRFGYLWTKVKALWIVGSYGGDAATRSYLIEASFDPCHRVSNVRLTKQWGESVRGSPHPDDFSEANFRRD